MTTVSVAVPRKGRPLEAVLDRLADETGVAALADESAAGALGERLDEVAATPGVEVRYTGPWPPYTFAPALETDR